MSVFVFAVDGSHLSIKLKTSDLFCVKRYSALSIDLSLIFGIFLNMWTCVTKFSSKVNVTLTYLTGYHFSGGDRKI